MINDIINQIFGNVGSIVAGVVLLITIGLVCWRVIKWVIDTGAYIVWSAVLRVVNLVTYKTKKKGKK